MPHTRSQSKNSGKGLKRSSTNSISESNQNKIPKIDIEAPNEYSKNFDGQAKRFENLDTRLNEYESSQKDIKNALVCNMKSINGLNSKLDKISYILNCMSAKEELSNEKNQSQIYYPFYGNIMSCQTFFNTEGLMTNYG